MNNEIVNTQKVMKDTCIERKKSFQILEFHIGFFL